MGTGGGIYSSGTLTITNSTIRGNQGYLAGGGIAGGAITITSSTISGNGASAQHDGQPYGRGGGISGSVTFTNSTLSGNYASLSAGGIDGGGNITNSTISGNNGWWHFCHRRARDREYHPESWRLGCQYL